MPDCRRPGLTGDVRQLIKIEIARKLGLASPADVRIFRRVPDPCQNEQPVMVRDGHSGGPLRLGELAGISSATGTNRLELHLPSEDELARLAAVAGDGVHERGAQPFGVP
jgi:hypothetical protein